MQTKECHTTKGTNTRTSQETSNLSVDMEEESSDMDNVNDRYTLCTEEAEEQPTSAADDLHLEDRNVNVMENADAYQELNGIKARVHYFDARTLYTRRART